MAVDAIQSGALPGLEPGSGGRVKPKVSRVMPAAPDHGRLPLRGSDARSVSSPSALSDSIRERPALNADQSIEAQSDQSWSDARSLDDRRRAALEVVAGTEERILRARADRLAATVDFAHLYPALDAHSSGAQERHAQGEAVVMDEGDGCPLVAEFATLEYAARMKMTPELAAAEMMTALKLRHRLPAVWDRVMALKLPVRVGEDLAWATQDLPFDLCVGLGRELAAMSGRVSGKRLLEHAKARVLQLAHQPALDARTKALRHRQVRFTKGEHTTHVEAFVSHQDGLWLKAQLDRVAGILGVAGDGADLDVRRSKALGLLANPARALQLLQADLECRDTESDASHDTLFDDLGMDPGCPAAGQRGHSCGQITVDPPKLLPAADLIVHLSDATLRDAASQLSGQHGGGAAADTFSESTCSTPAGHTDTGGGESGVAKVDGIGPVLAAWLRDLLAYTHVRVRPVLDLHQVHPVDAYQVPPRMREAVLLRHPTSVWPYSTRSSKHLDIDHTIPFDHGGPPGQTRIGNLGPLTRREHRAKTHGGWALTQPEPGVFDWTSPLGYRYRVCPNGTSSHEPAAGWTTGGGAIGATQFRSAQVASAQVARAEVASARFRSAEVASAQVASAQFNAALAVSGAPDVDRPSPDRGFDFGEWQSEQEYWVRDDAWNKGRLRAKARRDAERTAASCAGRGRLRVA